MQKQRDEFLETRYRQEAEQWNKYIIDGGIAAHAESWLRTDTVDYWRHARMYACIDPVLNSYPNSSWLTIGDGRYGRDAHYIQSRGHDVTASDISEALLQIGLKRGYINKYAVENAESLSFKDSAFDFVFTKECLHHLPRPWLGFYEMLRVARIGVVLIEPTEGPLVHKPRSVIKMLVAYYLRRYFPVLKSLFSPSDMIRPYVDRWENVGNYQFKLSEREIEKISIALNYSVCAFKYFNSAYITGVEHELLASCMWQEITSLIAEKNMLCDRGLNQHSYSLMACGVFKGAPEAACIEALQQAEYRVKILPKNPYVKFEATKLNHST